MSFPILVLAGVAFLALAGLAVLAALVIGIHRGDGHLANTPDSHADAFARRVLTGIRLSGGNSEGDSQ